MSGRGGWRGAAQPPRRQWLVASLRLNGTFDHWQGDTRVKAMERLKFCAQTLCGMFRGHIVVSPDLDVDRYGPDGEATQPIVGRQGDLGFNPYDHGATR